MCYHAFSFSFFFYKQVDPVIWCQTKLFLKPFCRASAGTANRQQDCQGEFQAKAASAPEAPNQCLSLLLDSWRLGALKSHLNTNTPGVSVCVRVDWLSLSRTCCSTGLQLQGCIMLKHAAGQSSGKLFHQPAWPINHPLLSLSATYLVS